MNANNLVALRVARTPEGWRRWYAFEVQTLQNGGLSISFNKRSPGFPSRAEAKAWADEHGLTVTFN